LWCLSQWSSDRGALPELDELPTPWLALYPVIVV
jgi:hypothetical protein